MKKKTKPERNGRDTTLYLDEKTRQNAKIIGNGSMSEGVRIAVDLQIKKGNAKHE